MTNSFTARLRDLEARAKATDEAAAAALKELLEAAHIVPVAWDGSDHPANGLPLCPTHHSAFDRHLFAYVPGSRELVFSEGVSSTELMITKDHLAGDVSDEALALRLRLFREVSGTSAE